ncbi:MAG: ROK family glucokinase [Alicyclobacillaceae bacterium]|nr:ROK family glucokinase [Alicyclobacillaceae bacterium]
MVASSGQILNKRSFDTPPASGVEQLCACLNEALRQHLAATGLREANVAGAGVGIPGFLDVDRGVVVEAVNLGWRDVPLVAELERVLGLPVAIENDANLAALGEAWTGAGRGTYSVLCVTVGTGVGGGIVIGGRLYRGVNGMAGEIGHLVVNRDGLPCNCGKRGCLETVASASAIVRAARDMQAQGRLAAGVAIEGAREVFELAAAGHEAARAIVNEAGHWLGYGLALCADTLNPDAIVVAGGVSKAREAWLRPVRDAFAAYALPRTRAAARLTLAALANDAGVIGAARLIAQQLGAAE